MGSENYIFLHSQGDLNWRFGKDNEHNLNLIGYGEQNRRFKIVNSANGVELLNVNLSSGATGIGTVNQYAATLHVNKPAINDIGGSIFITNTAPPTIGNKVRLGFDLLYFDDIIATASIDAKLMNTNGLTDLIFNAYDGSSTLDYYEKMRILGSNGFVGIGTASPEYKLDVCGTIRAKEVKVDLQGACPDFVLKTIMSLWN
ncbi:MAG TPA: hypothetical protein VHO50_05520 [Bacteroidales bacterium]|nr:hypothetical protein [Bacteroidales bacterium]